MKLNAQTLCVHSDSPNALKLAGAAARLLASPR
ncbi:MAG: LamB/YcsF family protein [Terriglobales bacterium]